MKKYVLLLALAGCAHKVPETPTGVVEVVKPVIEKEAIPILCTESVERPVFDSDTMGVGDDLETKVYRLTRSDAQHRVYESKLSEGFVKCGGRVSAK